MPRRRQSRAWFLVELERLSSGGYRLQPALSKELVERIAHQIDRSTAALSKEGTAADLLLTLFVPMTRSRSARSQPVLQPLSSKHWATRDDLATMLQLGMLQHPRHPS
jgi:hypothetical protein